MIIEFDKKYKGLIHPKLLLEDFRVEAKVDFFFYHHANPYDRVYYSIIKLNFLIEAFIVDEILRNIKGRFFDNRI